LALKRRQAERLGIVVSIIVLDAESTTAAVIQQILNQTEKTDGLLVQLPLPTQISTAAVLQAIPRNKDVDAVHFDGTDMTVLPPVVGAIAEICLTENCTFAEKKVVIVGEGKLVGAPVKMWCEANGWPVQMVNEYTPEPQNIYRTADVLVLGAGKAGLITANMINAGVYIFDAGAAEDNGKLVGDADPACAEKAALFTPVPGGIGPITVAVLMRNLVSLHKNAQKYDIT
jgi:methylenetetrahydrofolate dehydrogenase (NADP+)/methenyltetrahydrofolate cyclohydrolase